MFVKYHNWKIQWDLFENKYANYPHISFVPGKTKKKKKILNSSVFTGMQCTNVRRRSRVCC